MTKAVLTKLTQALDGFKQARILVIGDIIIDHFIWGGVSRISPEAPVPVVDITHENLLLGGAANVLNNLYALGASATLCGIIGNDAMGRRLLDLLGNLSSSTAGIISADDRPTTLKTRIIAQGQQVVRFDRENSNVPAPNQIARIIDFIDNHIQDFDAVIVSDYAKGVINGRLMNHLLEHTLKDRKIPVIADPKPRQPERFKGVAIITPNNHEAELMSDTVIHDENDLKRAADQLHEKLDCKAILVTRGEAGMALMERGKAMLTIPTVAKEVYDVTGAGDTVAATLALGLTSGLSFEDAAGLANFAAGIVVGKIGTATASREELRRVLA